MASAEDLGAVSKDYVTPTSNHGIWRDEEGGTEVDNNKIIDHKAAITAWTTCD